LLGGNVRLGATGSGWAGWSSVPDQSGEVNASRVIGDLAAGASRTLTLQFVSSADPSGTLGCYVNHVNGSGGVYRDKNQHDNEVRVAVRAG
jgi:hypothetical protein